MVKSTDNAISTETLVPGQHEEISIKFLTFSRGICHTPLFLYKFAHNVLGKVGIQINKYCCCSKNTFT